MTLNIFELTHRKLLEQSEAWNLIRFRVGMYFKNTEEESVFPLPSRWNSLFKLQGIFYGFFHWFRRYDYLFFSATSQRKLIEGYAVDRLCDPMITQLEQNHQRVLLIETLNASRIRPAKSRHIVSMELPSLMIRLIRILGLGERIVDIPLKNLINFMDIGRLLRQFQAEAYFYKIFFKVYRPKAIFLVSAYTKPMMIKVAKLYDINVIEIQHGVINQEHFGYSTSIRLKAYTNYTPDSLVTYGSINVEGMLISKIVPIGHFYLEHLLKTFIPHPPLLQKIEGYRIRIVVSMQNEPWEIEALLVFITCVAKKDSTILYLLIPRNDKTIEVPLPPNVRFYQEIDCYHTAMHCDIHVTLYSSCALETPSLGIPNLLIDARGFAQRYYQVILDPFHTKIVSEEGAFMEAVEELLSLDTRAVIAHNQQLFKSHYTENIKQFLTPMLS